MQETRVNPLQETLSVTAIKHGTVIDHIDSSQGLRISHLLSLHTSQHRITICLRLISNRMGKKDLIKIENHLLTEAEANEIVVFAPKATINIIQNFQVIKKITTHLPEKMRKVFICPNPLCITQAEHIDSHFSIHEQGKKIKLTCLYCEKIFDRDQVQVKI